MILALDFDGVIDRYPTAFRELAEEVLSNKGEVYIVSAVETGNSEKVRMKIEMFNIPHTKIIIIEYDSYGQVPRLKYEELSLIRPHLYIDDRKDTINYLNKRHILSLLL